ncbi:hypothetical protein AAG565_15705 [Fontimonas sp. SYSU GA230001]|uniref:hypothetical protein n=1 Tax=Fontimonas sp. SYSU GA230001 TaxID=3142450 RepID=UPI0032B3C548
MFPARAWMRQFSLRRAYCAKVFGVCEHTITRWRVHGRIPPPALQIVRTIERQSAPWNASFVRGWWPGVCQLTVPWRNELFAPPGGHWQDYRSPDMRALARDMARRAAQAATERAGRLKAIRLQAGRKAAATRRDRRASTVAGPDDASWLDIPHRCFRRGCSLAADVDGAGATAQRRAAHAVH